MLSPYAIAASCKAASVDFNSYRWLLISLDCDFRDVRGVMSLRIIETASCLSLTKTTSNIIAIRPQTRGREGIMEDLVGRLVANVGVDRSAAEKSVGIILDFLLKEGPADKVKALIDKIPGAEALLAIRSESGSGFSMGGIMGAGTKMMSAGLNMGQVQAVTRETIAYAREKIGDDAVGEIVGAIPGLSQFV
jgi:hypothetical protein